MELNVTHAQPSIEGNTPGIFRYESLDCLRGVAASLVMVYHTLVSLYGSELNRFVWIPPVAFILTGHQAVILFFVLSGFSLFLMFDSMRSISNTSLKFIAARWMRLYPAYILSVALAIAACYLLRHAQIAWPNNIYPTASKFLARDMFAHAVLVGVFDPNLYNPVLWSIVLEMRISIIFPLLYLLVTKMPITTVLTSVLFSVVIATWTYNTKTTMGFDGAQNVTFSFISTVYHATFFIFGAILARFRAWTIGRAVSATRAATAVAFVLCICIYTYASGWAYLDQGVMLGRMMLSDLIVGIASCGLIVLALAFPVLGRIGPLRGLGRISYSLYLIHFIFLEALAVFLEDSVPRSLLSGMIFVSALAASTAVWKYIDAPAIELSRAVRRFGKSRSESAMAK